jgi:hypothetical protein
MHSRMSFFEKMKQIQAAGGHHDQPIPLELLKF